MNLVSAERKSFPMELFRKYYDEAALRVMQEGQPDWGVTVSTVGHNIHQPKVKYPDKLHPNTYRFDWREGRVLNEFQLVYISNGQGTFEADGVSETTIEAGTAFLLFPGVWHRYKPSESTGWEEFWVGFQGHYADYLMKQNCFKPTSIIKVGFSAELLNVFIKLIETLKYEGLAHYQLSSCLVTQLLGLTYSAAIMTDLQRQNRNKIIHIARYKIHENLHRNINFQNLAEELNVSYPWFRKAFKEVIGTAPGQYHINIRLEMACKLLTETELTGNEIAAHLGFESEFYFSRIFKKKIGVPPGQYRGRLRHD
jgi:AraC-like DNA-binding protein